MHHHTVHPHGHTTHGMGVQIIGKMRIHLVIHQKEKRTDSSRKEQENDTGQAKNHTIVFIHGDVRLHRIYSQYHRRSGYIPDGPDRAPVSCADYECACQ